MDAAADRPEFAPPPQPGLLRAFALAVLAHLLLLLALTYGFHWQREAQDAAVEAELWSAVPQQAAPKPVPTPPQPPQPVVKPQPQPQPQPQAEPPAQRDADIALQKQKQEQQRQQELERQRAEQRAKAEAQKKLDQELARQKQEQARQLAEAKRKAEEQKRKEQELRDAKMREQLRQETLKRNLALAGTGPQDSTGSAARSSGPSGSWAGKVQARVRPNIVFSDDIPGNPTAEVEVRLGPAGIILGTPVLKKSSGSKAWDDAVIRALQKTQSLPADTDGRYPSPVIIQFRPKA
ncbi:MAG: cell envelope integrity protein TolA [Burkholderiales bacterium]|nr:cell envelope integrity protein TolA [Burkholderiales bacterium]